MADSETPFRPSRRRAGNRFVRILVEHGATPGAAGATDRAGRRLIAQTRDQGRELGLLLDAITGESVGPTLSGDRHTLDFVPLLVSLTLHRTLIAIHTHPAGLPPSDADLVLVTSETRIGIQVVIASDDTWYIVSRLGPGAAMAPGAVIDRYLRALSGLRPRRAALIGRGRPKAEVDRQLLHTLIEQIRADIGIGYDRIERKGV